MKLGNQARSLGKQMIFDALQAENMQSGGCGASAQRKRRGKWNI